VLIFPLENANYETLGQYSRSTCCRSREDVCNRCARYVCVPVGRSHVTAYIKRTSIIIFNEVKTGESMLLNTCGGQSCTRTGTKRYIYIYIILAYFYGFEDNKWQLPLSLLLGIIIYFSVHQSKPYLTLIPILKYIARRTRRTTKHFSVSRTPACEKVICHYRRDFRQTIFPSTF